MPNKGRYLTVGELAKRAGVTVRTLQYYDQQGLLSPSATDQQNHRLYSEADLEELYQILILKFLGLTLSEIKSHKESYGDVPTLRALANRQLKETEEKISDLLKTMTQLRELIEFASSSMGTGLVDWQSLANYLEKRQEAPEHFWSLISVQDSSIPAPDAEDEGTRKQQVEHWHSLIAQIIRLMQNGVAPESAEAQQLLADFEELLEINDQMGQQLPEFLLMGSRMAPPGADASFEKLSRDVGTYLQAVIQAQLASGTKE